MNIKFKCIIKVNKTMYKPIMFDLTSLVHSGYSPVISGHAQWSLTVNMCA